MQNLLNAHVKELRTLGHSDEQIIKSFLDASASASLLLKVSKALHG